MHIENLQALNHEQLCVLLQARLNSTEEWIVTLNNRTKNQAAGLSDLKDKLDVLNVNERMSSLGRCIASLEDSLAEIRQSVDRLTQQYVAPVETVGELAAQAEIDMMVTRMDHHPNLVSDLVSLRFNKLITDEEARKLLGFKK